MRRSARYSYNRDAVSAESVVRRSDLPPVDGADEAWRRNGRAAVRRAAASIRPLAEELVINPNTVAKAYRELEHEGVRTNECEH